MTGIIRYIIVWWAYSVGQPIMPDTEHTVLDRFMKVCFPKNPYYQHSWSNDPCPVAMSKEYGYPQLIQAMVLSDKTKSTPFLGSLIKVRTTYESMYEPHNLPFKTDGWNIQTSYYNGELVNVQTRGRSSDTMNAEVIAPRLPKTIPEMGRVPVTMEYSIPNSKLMWSKESLGSTLQHDAMSTVLANSEKCLGHVVIHAHGAHRSSIVTGRFTLLKSWGFEVPMYAWIHSLQELVDQVKAFSDFKEAYGIPTDSLVVEGEVTNVLYIEAWKEPIYRPFVTGYDETYGPHAIIVQCKIYSIKLPNSVQRQPPATNLSRIINLSLRPGCPVTFHIVSSPTADIDEESTHLMQKEYTGREDMRHHMVQMNEAMKY